MNDHLNKNNQQVMGENDWESGSTIMVVIAAHTPESTVSFM
jgi:hypothetical protein